MQKIIRASSVFIFSVLLLGSVQLIQDTQVTYAQSLGDDLICEIFEHLQSQGLPIPPGFDGSGCGENDGGSPPTPGVTQCSNLIDDDSDGLIDYLPGTEVGDPDCDSVFDDSEVVVVEEPVDVCPNLEGDQAVVPEGMEIVDGNCVAIGSGDEGGGDEGEGGNSGDNPGGGSTDASSSSGGGSAPTCSDLRDNDGDGLIDAEDPGCNNEFDGDESNPETLALVEEETSEETREETVEKPIACDAYVTSFMRFGAENESEQVTRLQRILINPEGFNVEETGTFDEKTRNAVQAFQAKYAEEILSPWGITEPTGYVYLTTRKKINELYCNAQFPLTEEEQGEIEAYRTNVAVDAPVVNENAGAALSPAEKVVEEPEAKVGEVETEEESQVAAVSEAIDETDERGIWSPIRNFLNRIFNRGN